MAFIDLHAHSTASDGTYTPAQLVAYALEKGLSALALTDHDTVDGVAEALAAAKGTPIEIIPGAEFSSSYYGRDIHIVCMFLNHQSPLLIQRLSQARDGREKRNEKMCALLKEHGIDISMEELREHFPNSTITRAHYKELMLKKGYVKSSEEAFERYIGDHAPCYVPRDRMRPEEAIAIIRMAGGVPVLAHPMQYGYGSDRLEELVSLLKDAGLEGIEVFYSTHTSREERLLLSLAEKYDLAPSGGSDFHGSVKKNIDLGYGQGNLPVRDEYLAPLRKRRPVRCLFTDMDGTLFNDRKVITPGNYTALSDFAAAGNHIVYSSGRSLDSMLDVLEEHRLRFPGSYISAYNGALIYECESGRVLFERRVPMEIVRDIFSMAETLGVHCQTYSGDAILTLHDSPELARYRHYIPRPAVIGEGMWKALTEDPCKVLAIQLDRAETVDRAMLLKEKVAEKYADCIESVFSNPYYLEFFSKDAGKGNALKALCSILNIPICDTIAAGDEENDLSMILEAGIGCAVQNATDKLRSKADYVCRNTCNHDAIQEILISFAG